MKQCFLLRQVSAYERGGKRNLGLGVWVHLWYWWGWGRFYHGFSNGCVPLAHQGDDHRLLRTTYSIREVVIL